MSSKLPLYLMRDGETDINGDYFNKVWADLDLRIDLLEQLRVGWLEATAQLTAFGLARINDLIGPVLDAAQAQLTAAQAAAIELAQMIEDADFEGMLDDAVESLNEDVELLADGIDTLTTAVNGKLSASTPVTVPQGGTGATTLTNHGVVIGKGANALAATGAGTSNQVLTSNGLSADPTFKTLPTRSVLVLSLPNGRGSTNTTVFRWTNVVSLVGTDFTYTDSPTLGGFVTINTPGAYLVPVDVLNGGAGAGVISLEQHSSLTNTFPNSVRRRSVGAGSPAAFTALINCAANDVIWVAGTQPGTGLPSERFEIVGPL